MRCLHRQHLPELYKVFKNYSYLSPVQCLQVCMLGSALILSSDDLSILKMVSIMFSTNVCNWKLWLFLCSERIKRAKFCDTVKCV